MSISVSEQKTAKEIAEKFNLPGKITGCKCFGSGHINNTFLLEMTENGGLTEKIHTSGGKYKCFQKHLRRYGKH